MKRTTIMADPATVDRLKEIAHARGVSFATVVREALEEKARSHRPMPESIGSGESRPSRTGSDEATRRQPPRSWR